MLFLVEKHEVVHYLKKRFILDIESVPPFTAFILNDRLSISVKVMLHCIVHTLGRRRQQSSYMAVSLDEQRGEGPCIRFSSDVTKGYFPELTPSGQQISKDALI